MVSDVILYHYLSEHKLQTIQTTGVLKPSAPFNSNIPETEWGIYAAQFSFPLACLYTCAFFEPLPQAWRDYGLFDLLMEEFSGGDHLLELRLYDARDRNNKPILVRDHHFHSPLAYGLSVDEWRKRNARDSRPDLRAQWYASTIPLHEYQNDYICPEVLVPFDILMRDVKRI